MPAGLRTLLQQYVSENLIPNIWRHQQNTRRSDQIETIKTIMQTTPSYHMEGFTNGSGYHFKKYSIKLRKDLDCELFYSELKRHNVSLYLLSSHR